MQSVCGQHDASFAGAALCRATQAIIGAMDLSEALSRSPLFAELPNEVLEYAGAALKRMEYTSGAHIWLEGDVAHSVYVLVSGQVRVYRLGAEGDEVVAGVFAPGDHFGEFGLFADGPRITSAQATQPTVCLAVAREPLLELLERSPLLMRRMLRSLSRTSRDQLEDFAAVALRDIGGRIARKLLELAERHAEPTGEGVRITMRLTQTDLARMIAASRANVNRALAALNADGVVRHEHGYFTILRPDALRERA